MAKSTRSKIKRHFRAKKRTEGIYAATEAARLNRLHQKLKALTTIPVDGSAPLEEEVVDRFSGEDEGMDADVPAGEKGAHGADAMDLDDGAAGPSTSDSSKRISTHGPRGSRREEWRLSKGLSARPPRKGMNRQGTLAARRKSGRSQRRR